MEILKMNSWVEWSLVETSDGMKFKWGTVKWNQKIKFVMQTANEMETEMVKLLCKDGVCGANCRWELK